MLQPFRIVQGHSYKDGSDFTGMHLNPESSLVISCLQGDRKAQRRLYERYCDAMYNLCYRMMGNTPEAEDALQETFIDVFRKLGSFRGESTLGAWIKRIAINHCITMLGKRKIVFEEMKEAGQWPAAESSEDKEEINYEVTRVKDAIMKLPDGYRQVLTLYLLEGYDHGEIASILGIQETGSKSQYSRAKSRLREMLSNETQS